MKYLTMQIFTFSYSFVPVQAADMSCRPVSSTN